MLDRTALDRIEAYTCTAITPGIQQSGLTPEEQEFIIQSVLFAVLDKRSALSADEGSQNPPET